MTKGLAIARAFYHAGHNVIGADFEPYGIPVCGRFSTSLKNFYRLPKPSLTAGGSTGAYINALIQIVKLEGVDLWVSCSGVASAVEDGHAAEAVKRETDCKAIQFGEALTKTLHEKHSFIENTLKLGLNVPDTHLITSTEEATQFLSKIKEQNGFKRNYILKSVGMDDSVRADMTLLPRPSVEETRAHIARFKPSSQNPCVLQQFINGTEYCTPSIIIRGQVRAFTACPSAELLMHYNTLPPASDLSNAMLNYTQEYAKRMGDQMTGHFSIDFLVDEHCSERNLMRKIYPIECNPRAHTAVVLFADQEVEMAEAYLSIFLEEQDDSVVMAAFTTGYYWIGHDVVTSFILPTLDFLAGKCSISHLVNKWSELFHHLISWRDGTYEIWDPWPFCWLYCVYWPGMFTTALLTGRMWSRCNVSTTKMFAC